MKTFSFRFDIDSLADIEIGVPKLIDLGKELDVRFTFFVNMGRSFNWKTLGKGQGARGKGYSTIKKIGLLRALRTVILNPDIGLSHKKILFELLDQGHELGLHGGMDHPLWQWQLDALSKDEISGLLEPAYKHFAGLFGRPKGFASPGFRYNRHVLELIDDYGFEYASDMGGERPFRPEGFRHIQIPVNIIGPDKRPLIEHLIAFGCEEEAVEATIKKDITKMGLAVIYGHPAFEGRFGGLREILAWVISSKYQIMPMGKLLEQPSIGGLGCQEIV